MNVSVPRLVSGPASLLFFFDLDLFLDAILAVDGVGFLTVSMSDCNKPSPVEFFFLLVGEGSGKSLSVPAAEKPPPLRFHLPISDSAKSFACCK